MISPKLQALHGGVFILSVERSCMHSVHMTESIPAVESTRLRELYEAAGLERYDVAALLRRSEAMVRRYETGETPIPPLLMRQLARRFAVTVEHLMGWDRPQAA